MNDIMSKPDPLSESVFALYDTGVYNSLDLIRDARLKADDDFNSKIAESFAPVFINNSVNYDVSINLIHKHFDLEDGECLVETQKLRHSTIIAEKIGSDPLVQPYLWKLVKDSKNNRAAWYPLEFVRRSREIDNNIDDRIKRVFTNTVFIQQFIEKLFETGLEDSIGLMISNRQHLQGTFETNDTNERTLKLVPLHDSGLPAGNDFIEMVKSGKVTKTTWRFDPSVSSDPVPMSLCDPWCDWCMPH